MTSRALFAAAALALVATSCKAPDPPTLQPKEIRVTTLTTKGIDVLVRVEAVNPNKKELSVRSVTASLMLAGKHQLGTVQIDKPIVLPPAAPTMIEAPMTMPWTDVSSLGMLSTTQGSIPYTLSGTVNVGGDRLNVNLPFSIAGTITREQLTSATLKGLPPIPGLR